MLLGCIKKQPGIGVSELAQQEGIKPPTISLHVKELEAAGLVTRMPAEGDRRRAPLMVTPAGQQVLAETFGLWVNWIAGRLEHLTPEARAALHQALDPLRELNS
jgi:DNA-binding MarR family transcriptional regulator